MNRDIMLVTLGVGVGALISSEQGRHIIGSLSKTPLAQALGEGVVNMFKNKDNSANDGHANASALESEGNHDPHQPLMEAGQSDRAEQGA